MLNEDTAPSPSASHSSSSSGETASSETVRHSKAVYGDLRQASGVSDQLVLPDDLCEELHAAVQKAAIRSAGSINALRLAVKRFTVALRDDGAKPETVLIALKSVINSETFPVAELRTEEWTPNELRQQISSWSIQEFFSERQA